ncbi:MAG: uroporphyrinogen decarboxylase family protein [Candidatus Thorarchaeota archaeon]
MRMVSTIIKSMAKAKLGLHLKGHERFLLTSLFSKVDRVATLLVPPNIHPQLINPEYDFIRLTNSAEANLELFAELTDRFPNVDAAVPACWMGLAGLGQEMIGTTMRIDRVVEPTPDVYALDRCDLDELSLPAAEGALGTRIELTAEVQKQFPHMTSPPVINGAYDLAFMLRGEKLIRDFAMYKDYTEATDEGTKEKVRTRGDPSYFSRLMSFTTQASIAIGRLYEKRNVNMLGMAIVDQYANPPIMSPQDFFNYIYPYVEEVWRAFKKHRPTAGYMPTSPEVAKEIMRYPALSGIACFNNYMFPQNELGLTPPEYDREMITLSRQLKTPYQFLLHGKFMRDGTEDEIATQVRRVCEVAVEMEAPMAVGVASVPLGTDLSKVDAVLNTVEQYGRYR